MRREESAELSGSPSAINVSSDAQSIPIEDTDLLGSPVDASPRVVSALLTKAERVPDAAVSAPIAAPKPLRVSQGAIPEAPLTLLDASEGSPSLAAVEAMGDSGTTKVRVPQPHGID